MEVRTGSKLAPVCNHVSVPTLCAEKTWKVLEDAIHEINNHNASGLSFEELYRCVERST